MTTRPGRKERRLWAAVLTVIVAILAGSIAAGTLVERWGTEAVLGGAFAVGLGLAAAAVVGTALSGDRGRPLWIALGVVAAAWMIPIRGGLSALERTHLFEYGLLAVLLHEALVERRSSGAGPSRPAVVAVVVASLLGWLDEVVQALVPGRVYDLRDVGVNALAAGVAVAIVVGLRWARSPRR
jgi:hypothetical protein